VDREVSTLDPGHSLLTSPPEPTISPHSSEHQSQAPTLYGYDRTQGNGVNAEHMKDQKKEFDIIICTL
jgi:hypothetical protein